MLTTDAASTGVVTTAVSSAAFLTSKVEKPTGGRAASKVITWVALLATAVWAALSCAGFILYLLMSEIVMLLGLARRAARKSRKYHYLTKQRQCLGAGVD